jgi:hypothetical protein
MGRPYECPPQLNIPCQPGVTTWVEIGFPSRSTITKIILVQQGPIREVPIVLALYNRATVMSNGSLSLDMDQGTGNAHPDLFRVTDDLTGIGKIKYFADKASGGNGYDFYSQDEQRPGREFGNNRMLYAAITTPPGSGETYFFDLVIGGKADD